MEVLAEKTEYTLFGARETNLLSLKVGETALKEECTPKLLGLTMQPHKGLSKHVMCMKAAANTRLLQLRAVALPEWGPDRENLPAFYLALVQAKMCYGVASWWFDTSLSDRERLERVQAQVAHIVAGIPKAANREDALREARLKPINEVAHRRALEYCLRLKAKSPVHAKVADSIFPPEHPIHVRLAKVQHSYSTIDSPEKPHDAKVLQLVRRVHFNTTTPGGLKADAPEKDKKVHTMRPVQRFSDFGYQVWTDVSVVLDVSSGAGALVYTKDGLREKVVLGAGSLACSYRAECVAMEAGLEEARGCHGAEHVTQDTGARIHRLVAAADGAERWSCSSGGRDAEARLGPHAAHCAAPRVRQLPVRVLALRGAAKRGGRQCSRAWKRETAVVSGVDH
ncbi:hypothetical protein ERJ75_001114000 [Trypanosoma vivax]|uniref:Reverse transcriptase (RNA-dependent DNA polymerase) n=1 Tax=Trypanosoma vivax (strain Y486) TaxID=1055687 RepID=F9WU12_TRYVY|nr:hypothetical protein ERJ75_001114000 [Trypanosoma vivax]CCD21058.1 reverse transcriptase (RNA-dependent DNA polymerase) [Trypanosoma vivax Y486]|eukprot:CCD21058.1 reverse transcriptase (RNA-dependent DNA polymerase) [Trypanosoma vivax Y486]